MQLTSLFTQPLCITYSTRPEPSQQITRLFQDRTFISKQETQHTPARELWDPLSNGVLSWGILVALVVNYFLYETGMTIAFGEEFWHMERQNPTFLVFTSVCIVILVVNIPVTLNTGFYQGGILVMDRRKIYLNFSKAELWIDLFLIIVTILCLPDLNYNLNYLKLVYLLKIAKVYRVGKLIERRLQVHRVAQCIYFIMSVIGTFILLSHITGIIFYLIDLDLLQKNYDKELLWLVSNDSYDNILEQPWHVQYLFIQYWGINSVMLISYGDITPGTPVETLYVLIVFIVSFGVFTFFTERIISAIRWAKQPKEKFREQICNVSTTMTKQGLSQDTKNRVIEYLEFQFVQEDRDQNSEKQLINKLPSRLRSTLLEEAYKDLCMVLMESIPMPSDFICSLLGYVRERNFESQELIFEQGQLDGNIYQLNRGQVRLEVRYGHRQKQELNTISIDNQLFGVLQTFTNQKRRYSAVAVGETRCFEISRQAIQDVLSSSETHRELWYTLSEEVVILQKYSLIHHQCEICLQDHDFMRCPGVFLQHNRAVVLKTRRWQKPVRHPMDVRTRRTRMHVVRDRKEDNGHCFRIKMDQTHYEEMRLNAIRFKVERHIAVLQYLSRAYGREIESDIKHEWKHFRPQDNFQIVTTTINHKK